MRRAPPAGARHHLSQHGGEFGRPFQHHEMAAVGDLVRRHALDGGQHLRDGAARAVDVKRRDGERAVHLQQPAAVGPGHQGPGAGVKGLRRARLRPAGPGAKPWVVRRPGPGLQPGELLAAKQFQVHLRRPARQQGTVGGDQVGFHVHEGRERDRRPIRQQQPDRAAQAVGHDVQARCVTPAVAQEVADGLRHAVHCPGFQGHALRSAVSRQIGRQQRRGRERRGVPERGEVLLHAAEAVEEEDQVFAPIA